MLFSKVRSEHNYLKVVCQSAALLVLWLLAASAGYADDSTTTPTVTSPTANDMLSNITSQIPQLMKMVTAIAYVLGIYFIYVGIHKLKQFGESRTMMTSSPELKGSLLFLLVGSALLYLPTTVQVGMSTFWDISAGFGYLPQGDDQWTTMIRACFSAIQLFGTVAVIRGLIMLTHLGQGQGQPGQLSKAMTHIIAGIFCLNIYVFIQVITATLGVSVSF